MRPKPVTPFTRLREATALTPSFIGVVSFIWLVCAFAWRAL